MMPSEPSKYCNKSGCGNRVYWPETYCAEHKPKADAEHKERRRRKIKNPLYGSRWADASRVYRINNPWCAVCASKGIYELATLVDHIVPHRGKRALFWDVDNWQGLCTACHAVKSGAERRK